MFFFSAATYNGHRIHYDKEWARESRRLRRRAGAGPASGGAAGPRARRLDRGRGTPGVVLGAEPGGRLSGPAAHLRRRRSPASASPTTGDRAGRSRSSPAAATTRPDARARRRSSCRGAERRRDRAAWRGGHRRHRRVARRTPSDPAADVHPRPVRGVGEDGRRGRRRRSRHVSTACSPTASPNRRCSHRPRCANTSACLGFR